MGSFDCYCALCSGPLGIGCISFGSSSEKALARRRKRVENTRRRLKGEKVVHEDSKEWKDMEKEEDERDKVDKPGGCATDKDADMEGIDDGESFGEHNGNIVEDEGPWDEEESPAHTVEMDGHDGEGEEGGEEWEDGSSDHDEEEQDEHEDVSSHHGALQNLESLVDDASDYSDHASQASELSVPGDFDMYATDETSSMHSYEENQSYDPVRLSKEDVQWVDRSRVLAINRELKSRKKAFLSGRGRYEDYVSPL
jgi:hypothetical protein